MIDIAYAEDEAGAAEEMRSLIAEYQEKASETLKLSCFPDGLAFLEQAEKEAFDIVLLDIDMPGIDGMEAARRLRRRDSSTVLIFVTNMAQFAVQGYEVAALDFIVKPIRRAEFFPKLDRAVAAVTRSRGIEITLRTPSGLVRFPCATLSYVEVFRHTLVYHTEGGTFECRGSLADEETRLAPYGFARCGKSFLVNMAQIRRVDRYELELLSGETLEISHPRRKAFMECLARYLGEKE